MKMLEEFGVRCAEGHSSEPLIGFPVAVPLKEGGWLCLDLPTPGTFGLLDPEAIGFAVMDPLGYARRTWGLAKRIPFFKPGISAVDTPILGLLQTSMAGGSGSTFLDGYRFFTAPVPANGRDEPGAVNDVLILVVNAVEEEAARRRAAQSERLANALKRVGKVLTMNQGIAQICQAAAHEIASATELAGAMVWITTPDGKLSLKASIGITRPGVLELEVLDPDHSPRCIAELVAASGRKFFQRNVMNHVMTASLEANSCYLKPGGVCAYPLMAGGKLLGVVEIIGRDGDPNFEDHDELFETFAEHLSLALNAATMFETAERYASHDALTGIANHRTMQEFFHRNLTTALRNESPIAVLMLDVDHFRSFNEEEGHDAGDRVLRLVAQTITNSVRTLDLAARYGGEEFTVVMPGSGPEAALYAAERIRAAVEATPFESATGQKRHITVSVGVAAYPDVADDVSRLLKAADVALYQAKRSGRNLVKIFEGQFEGYKPPHSQAALQVEQWIRPEVFEETRNFEAWARPEASRLAEALQLSDNQVEILYALIQVAHSHRWLRAENQKDALLAMEASPEFRLLLPSLHTLDERIDGQGPRGLRAAQIPLLARIMQILLAAHEGIPLWEDKGRFDLEILGLHSNRRAA